MPRWHGIRLGYSWVISFCQYLMSWKVFSARNREILKDLRTVINILLLCCYIFNYIYVFNYVEVVLTSVFKTVINAVLLHYNIFNDI